MARYYGKIGYAKFEETVPGVHETRITERTYYGDIIRNVRKLETTEHLNDNINISNTISIISDPFANENFHAIRYATYMDSKWKVVSVEVQRPRLILSLGGVYNE